MDFGSLIQQVEKINQVFTDNAAKAINRNLTARNWLTGVYIVNYEQNGSDRAKYGEKTLQKMAERLNAKSLSYRNLKLYRQFYQEFPMLSQPIYDFVVNEFASENGLIGDITLCLSENNYKVEELATNGCQIGRRTTNAAGRFV